MSKSKIILGKMLKHRRIETGLTLEELAKILKTDRQYIWKIENGKINMSLDYLDKVLTELGSNPKELFRLVYLTLKK